MLWANKKAFHCKSYLEGMILITKEIITEILNIKPKNGPNHHKKDDYDPFFHFLNTFRETLQYFRALYFSYTEIRLIARAKAKLARFIFVLTSFLSRRSLALRYA